MVGVPLFGDQMYNAKRIVYKGFGLQLDLHAFTPTDLVRTLVDVIQNPCYKAKIKKASAIFRSRPETPRERAVSSIEEILRFGGEHLRSITTNMPFYKFLMLDILAFISSILVAVSFIVKWLMLLFCRRCYRV